jgi:hypothetical protein
MNLEMIRTKVEVAGWKFRCKHPLGRKWAGLSQMDRMVAKLVALNSTMFIVLFILYETSKSS